MNLSLWHRFPVVLILISLINPVFLFSTFSHVSYTQDRTLLRRQPITTDVSSLPSTHSKYHEDLFTAVHRKEHEMKMVHKQHSSISDPVQMALGYVMEIADASRPPPLKLAKALRRVHEMDPPLEDNRNNNNNNNNEDNRKSTSTMGMRRASFIVDIKRRSLSRPGQTLVSFDDAGHVAEAMVQLGADVVFVNVDYHAYGGDMTELRSAVKAVRKVSKTAAVVMKDIVVDEIQLGLAKDAGVDGILLIASVLGPALGNFLDLATSIGLETIVECHTRNEVQAALDALAQNILVSNYDRVQQRYFPDQAYKLAGMFPGSGGPIICLAGGGLEQPEEMRRMLAIGYDGVVVGRACMGSTRVSEFIKTVRDQTFLPTEFSQWGLEDVEFDNQGNLIQ